MQASNRQTTQHPFKRLGPPALAFDDLKISERKRLAETLSAVERAEVIALALVGSGLIAPQSWRVVAESLQSLPISAASNFLVLGQELDTRIVAGLAKLERLGAS